ncbi:MAG: hypothetical protein V1905_02105 [bacterium]
MKIRSLLLYLLITAIALSPTLFLGTSSDLQKNIDIRVEDILLITIVVVSVVCFLINKTRIISQPPLFIPIVCWVAFGMFGLLINIALGNVYWLRGFFYFLKEIEFFLIYFFVYYSVKNESTIFNSIKLWVVLGAVNIGYVIYQALTGQRRGEYGTAAIGEWGAFPTGAFFLLMFLFLINFYLYHRQQLTTSAIKQISIITAVISLILGVFGSASKTNFLGLFFGILVTLAIYFLKKKSVKVLALSGLAIIFLVGTFVLALTWIPDTSRLLYVLKPEQLLLNYDAGRLTDAIVPQFTEAIRHPLLMIIGFGKGAILVYQESHNQYLRNLVETGLIGSVFFVFLILSIIKKAWAGFNQKTNSLSVGLSAGLLVATLTMLFLSFATEPFIVVKPSEVYWFFAGLTMASMSLSGRNILKNYE